MSSLTFTLVKHNPPWAMMGVARAPGAKPWPHPGRPGSRFFHEDTLKCWCRPAVTVITVIQPDAEEPPDEPYVTV